MKLTVINLFHTAEEGFDAGPLEEFCRAYEVRGWVEHFFLDGGNPRLAMVLEYEEIVEARASGRPLRSERDFRRELPAIVGVMPATKEALRASEGIGKGKSDRYAEDVRFDFQAPLSPMTKSR